MKQNIMTFFLRHRLIRGTMLLTASGLLVRIAGFFYKIFLSRTIGADQIGLFSLTMPLFAFFTAVCGGGIQTAISRFVSEYRATGDNKGARRILAGGLLLSSALSVPCALLLYFAAPWFAARILMEPDCAPLLRVIAPSLPFGMIHSCLDGWFTGEKKILPPALTQMAEQLLRIVSAVWVCLAMKQVGQTADAAVMATGQLCGEIAAAACSFLFLSGVQFRFSRGIHSCFVRKPDAPDRTSSRNDDSRNATCRSNYSCTESDAGISGSGLRADSGSNRLLRNAIARILSVSVPISLNRALMCVLQSSEAALLPQMLQQSGLTGARALAVYGTLTGMALPLILFPTAVTGSFGMLLLPAVSEARALHQPGKITAATNAGFSGGLALGSFFFGIFLLFGDRIGILLFQSALAGNCIRKLSLLCPLLYIGMSLTGILHALGKTSALLLWNLSGFALRLICILTLVPTRGLDGCLFGLLSGHALVSLCMLAALRRAQALTLSVSDAVLRLVFPSLLALCPAAALRYAFPEFSRMLPGFLFAVAIYCSIFLFALYLLLPRRKTV